MKDRLAADERRRAEEDRRRAEAAEAREKEINEKHAREMAHQKALLDAQALARPGIRIKGTVKLDDSSTVSSWLSTAPAEYAGRFTPVVPRADQLGSVQIDNGFEAMKGSGVGTTIIQLTKSDGTYRNEITEPLELASGNTVA